MGDNARWSESLTAMMQTPPGEPELDVEMLTRELAAQGPMEAMLLPTTVLQLSALLQLALRHPGVTPTLRDRGELFLQNVRAYFAHCPTALDLVQRGDDPACDVSPIVALPVPPLLRGTHVAVRVSGQDAIAATVLGASDDGTALLLEFPEDHLWLAEADVSVRVMPVVQQPDGTWLELVQQRAIHVDPMPDA